MLRIILKRITGLVLLLTLGWSAVPARAQEPKSLERTVRLAARTAKDLDPTMRLLDTPDAILMYGLLQASGALGGDSSRLYVEEWANYQVRIHGISVVSPDRAIAGLPMARLFQMTDYQHFFLASDRIMNRILRHLPRLDDGTVSSLATGQVGIEEAFQLGPFLLIMANITGNDSVRREGIEQILRVRRLTEEPTTAFSRHTYDSVTGELSLEVYGKGNAMAAAALAEALVLVPKDDEDYKFLMLDYKRLMLAAIRAQDRESGFWRILPLRPETPVDSATTGLFLFAVLRGLDRGWLPSEPFTSGAGLACRALISATDDDGKVMETTGRVEPGSYENYRLPLIGAFPDGAGALLLAGAEALETGFDCGELQPDH